MPDVRVHVSPRVRATARYLGAARDLHQAEVMGILLEWVAATVALEDLSTVVAQAETWPTLSRDTFAPSAPLAES